MPEVRAEVIELARLLSAPDPPELPRRRARLTQAGDPRRRETVLLPLLVRWAQWRCLAADPEPVVPPHQTVRDAGDVQRAVIRYVTVSKCYVQEIDPVFQAVEIVAGSLVGCSYDDALGFEF